MLKLWKDLAQWRIMVVCPVCRSKPIKIKEGVDIREVVEKIKSGRS